MKTPPHAPNLAGNNYNHSIGYLDITFSDNSWIQVGWLGGCLGKRGVAQLCEPQGGIGLYDESFNAATGAYILGTSDGSLGFNATDTYRIEYFGGSTDCWDVFNGYDHLLRSLCSTFPHSGAPTASSEIWNGNTPSTAVEMPYTYYGSTNPNSNSGLRIKGASGYVGWTTTLSTGSTDSYDERVCPNTSYCLYSPAYFVSDLVSGYYYVDGFGDTS